MDNLTHSLCGWTLARAGLNRYGKWVTPLLILTANLPDLETVLLPGGSRAAYLLYHRGITHSPAMLTFYALLFGALLWFLERRARTSPALRFFPAVGICAAGLFSHLLLDWFNSYGVRPGLPFDSTWFYGDLLFIVDPWVWLLFALPIFMGSTFDRNSVAAWVVAVLITTVIVCVAVNVNLVPWPAIIIWLSVIGFAILLRHRAKADEARCARGGLLVLGLYMVLVFAASRTALERGKASIEAAIPGAARELIKTSVMPYPAEPWRYDVLLQTSDTLSQVSVNLFGSDAILQPGVKLHLDDPALDKIRGTLEYRAWRSFARHPYVVRQGNVLILGDLRFKTRGGDWTRQRVEIPLD